MEKSAWGYDLALFGGAGEYWEKTVEKGKSTEIKGSAGGGKRNGW